MKIIEKIAALEANYKEENFSKKNTFDILMGDLPVIISAPHSVTHFRNGKRKQGEFMTGAIVKLLQERLNCYSITKTRNDQTDPNYDEVHPYKEEIKKLINEHGITLLLDLHIMHEERPAAIEIGTGRGKNVFHDTLYANVLKQSFESFGISPIIVDQHFTGGFKFTVSSDISQSTNIPCIQIEINWGLLDLRSQKNQILTVLDSLAASIVTLRRK